MIITAPSVRKKLNLGGVQWRGTMNMDKRPNWSSAKQFQLQKKGVELGGALSQNELKYMNGKPSYVTR